MIRKLRALVVFTPVVFFLSTPVFHDVLPSQSEWDSEFWKATGILYLWGIAISILPIWIYWRLYKSYSSRTKRFKLFSFTLFHALSLTAVAYANWNDSDSFYIGLTCVLAVGSLLTGMYALIALSSVKKTIIQDRTSGNFYYARGSQLHSVSPSEEDSYRNMIANGQLRAVMFDSAKISGFDASAPSIPLSAVSIPIQDFSPHHAFDPASSMGINPTTGIPMISGAIDAGGNTWGSGHTIDAFPANGFANGADTFTNPNSGYDYHSPSANPGYDPNRGY